MYKKILLVFLLLILSVNFVSASENLTDMALNDEALSADIEVTGYTFDDIQKSVDDANVNDVVKLKENNYTCLNKEISIDKSITIENFECDFSTTTQAAKVTSQVTTIQMSQSKTLNSSIPKVWGQSIFKPQM